mgnify:CR=1 FL=1
MAQLKIKQISDFISGVNAIHNGAAGTDTVTAISTAKSEAISQAVVNGDIAYDVNGAGAAAIAAAESKDVLRASTTASNLGTAVSNLESYADQAEVDAKSYADGLASDYDASGSAAAAQSAAIASAESKDVLRAATAVTNIATAKSEAISQAVVNGDIAYDANGAAAAAIDAAESKDVVRAIASQAYADQAEVDAKSYADGLASDYDANGSAAAAQSAAIASAEAKDVLRANASQAYADQAELDAIASAESKDVVRATASQSYADQAEADAIATAGSYTDTREVSILSVLRGELAAVAGTDILEQVGVFTNATSFRAPTQLSLVNNDILVFVNGLQVHKASEGVDGYTTSDGQSFTVSGLGYDLESSDHIIVVGVAV